MTLLSPVLALAVACVPAWVWLQRLVPAGLPARRALLAGYALLLGMLGTTLAMRLLSLLGIPFSLTALGVVAALLAAAGLAAPRGWRTPAAHIGPAPSISSGRWQGLLVALLFLLLASRLAALGVEVCTRPMFAWDAKQHWARQALVFFDQRRVVEYVPLEEWLQRGGPGVYTSLHPDYPIATPLLQAFMALALGRWDGSLVNLPWPATWLGLGLVFFAQARISGAGRATALAATYMVLSLPYLDIQVALAGYADLLLGACYAAAVAAFYQWSQRREAWQLLLAGLAAGAGLLVKHEGFLWCLSLLPGLLLVLLGARRGLCVAGALGAAAVGALWLLPHDLALAGHTVAELRLQYRPAGWVPTLRSFLVHDNWHLLVWVFLALLLALPLAGRGAVRALLPLLAVVGSALAVYLSIYLLTSNAYGARHYTSLNRVALQLMPAVGFVALQLYLRLAANRPHGAGEHAPADGNRTWPALC